MATKEIVQYVFAEASKSNVDKRKVGCIITNAKGKIVAAGRNAKYEDEDIPDLHAEDMACQDFETSDIKISDGPFTAYVSHQPCPKCAEILLNTGITNVEIVEEFMKFDGGKLRLDLVPPSATKALAEVLTFGARKYKPNNWRNCKELDRYEGALLRHIQAYREGESHDKDSGMPHLWHAMTNLAFLIELDGKSKTKKKVKK